jgi:regulator of replication initiation timing
MEQRDRNRLNNLIDTVDYLREENARLREENDRFRERLIAFTGEDPR